MIFFSYTEFCIMHTSMGVVTQISQASVLISVSTVLSTRQEVIQSSSLSCSFGPMIQTGKINQGNFHWSQPQNIVTDIATLPFKELEQWRGLDLENYKDTFLVCCDSVWTPGSRSQPGLHSHGLDLINVLLDTSTNFKRALKKMTVSLVCSVKCWAKNTLLRIEKGKRKQKTSTHTASCILIFPLPGSNSGKWRAK